MDWLKGEGATGDLSFLRLHIIHRYAEVPQDRKYHIYQTRFLYNGSATDSDSGAPDTPASAAGTKTAPALAEAASSDGHLLVHHAILYAVMQVSARIVACLLW